MIRVLVEDWSDGVVHVKKGGAGGSVRPLCGRQFTTVTISSQGDDGQVTCAACLDELLAGIAGD